MTSGNGAKRSKIGVGLVEVSLSVKHTPRAYHRHVNVRVSSQAFETAVINWFVSRPERSVLGPGDRCVPSR